MISSHRDRVTPAEEAASFMLVAGSTPHSGWQRLLPLFERAGCTLPEPMLLEEWQASVRGSAALGQPGVAMLHPGAQQQSLRAASATLLGACLPPVLLSVEEMEARPEFWLEELQVARLLMFHTRPETALVAAMAQDCAPDEALMQWIAAAETLVQTFRRNRRRVALLDVECALSAPIDFLRNCKTWLGLQPQPYSAAASMPERVGSDMQYLIAAQMVAQSPRLADLIAELEACSLPIGEPAVSPIIDCAALYAIQREEQERRRIVEEEHIQYRILAEERAERLTAIECARDEAVARLREGENRLADFEARIKVLAEIDRPDTKLTGEHEKKANATEQARSELAQENELLLLQLHQVQEELEIYHMKLKAANDKLRNAENEIRSYGQQLRSSKAKLESMERKLKFRERRIRYMEESRSWKITAPLRNAIKLFSRASRAEGGADN